MKFSLNSTMNMNWQEVMEVAKAAEDCGFEEFYTADHLKSVAGFDDEKGLLDGVALLPALGTVTKTIRLSMLVSPITFRDPVIHIRQLHTADVISNGRVMFGLGAGWDPGEHEEFGYPFPPIKERLQTLDKFCARIREYWPQIRPKAPKAEPRILVAGASKALIATAGRYCDVLTIQGSPGYVREAIPKIRAIEKEVDRKLKKPLEIAVRLMTIFPDDSEMTQWHKTRTSNMQSGKQAKAQAATTLPGEDPGARNYVGPREGLKDRIAEYEAIGVERLIFGAPRSAYRAGVESLARTIGM